MLDRIESFLTGDCQSSDSDRVLATVLFADIVGSTERAVQLGDRRWEALLQSYYAVARRQMWGFGGMMSFEVDERRINAGRFLRRLQLITPALSLGGVETIICAPAATSHSKLTPAERAALGISDGLLRLSVGIEDADDIIADLAQALPH